MGINPINNISIIIRILFAVTLFQHVQGTVQFGIHYSSRGSPLLVGLTDSDWPMTLMIESLLSVMFSSLVLNLSLGLVRNNKLLLLL
jgi:hypothetical protein